MSLATLIEKFTMYARNGLKTGTRGAGYNEKITNTFHRDAVRFDL